MNDDILTEGFYTFYHTRDLKGGLLNINGTMIMTIEFKKEELFIPIDEDTKIGDIHNLISKYIDLYSNKFIITGADAKDNIFLISIDDYVMKLMENGIEFFNVHEHEYDVNFLDYRFLTLSLKKLQFHNQNFNIQLYVHDQMTVNILKQLVFDRIYKLFDMNIGLEFENAEGFIFDNRIAATLRKNEIIAVNVFEIRVINFTFEFDGGEADMESNNNITVYELEQQLRENFCLGKNVKLFSNMKKINKQNYVKNYEKFQMVYKNMDNQYSMCEMIDRQYEIIVRDMSFCFVGRFFNGWDINGLED
jgi:hypothetical protein